MKIVNDTPPNYGDISRKFDVAGKPVVFTYGDTLYNPTGAEVPAHLLIHEEAHAAQQGFSVAGAKKWWKQYLEDPAFRRAQELEAYQRQYQYVCVYIKDRNARARFLHKIASDFSGGTYGNVITYSEAVDLIQP